MSHEPQTRQSLLMRVRDTRDTAAWRDFVDLYAPLIYRFARGRGLQDADAADVAQNVLGAVARNLGEFDYDPALGKFRTWLFEITRRQVLKWQRGQLRQTPAAGGSEHLDLLNQAPAAAETDEWDREYQQQRFLWAARRVEAHADPTLWQAFWRTAVENVRASEVAEALGLSVGAVYTAKSRILTKIKLEIEQYCEE